MIFKNFVEKCIPDNIKKNASDFTDAKNIVGSIVLTSFVVPFFAILYWQLNFHLGTFIILFEGLFIFVCVLFMRYVQPLFWIREIIVGSLFLTLAWLSYHLGGVFSSSAYWLILPPLAAFFYGGLVTGVCWGFLSILFIMILYALQCVNYPLPMTPITSHLILQAESISGLVIVILTLAYWFEKAKRDNAAELRNANEKLSLEKKRAEELVIQAQEASQAKSAFLAAMSHEIRTPLNGILGMTDILMGAELNEDQKKCVNVINISGTALLSIINNILDFSKIESGKMDTDFSQFEFSDLIENVVDIIAAQIRSKGLNINTDIDLFIPKTLVGDHPKVRQILTNLLMNATKFTSQGNILIRAILFGQERKNVTVKFEVIDTGIGIPADVRARLFAQFSQGDASTTRKYGGTGLGLAISKRLTEMLGGNIGVDSTPGKGSKFWFTMPFSIPEK